MSRLMSVSLTEQAVVDRRKTVTRRLGWRFVKAGDRLTLCRKVMGRRAGEPLVKLAEVEVLSADRVLLGRINAPDVRREAVPGMEDAHPDDWVRWFCGRMRCTPYTEVTRIEWRYLDRSCHLLAADGMTPEADFTHETETSAVVLKAENITGRFALPCSGRVHESTR